MGCGRTQDSASRPSVQRARPEPPERWRGRGAGECEGGAVGVPQEGLEALGIEIGEGRELGCRGLHARGTHRARGGL